MFCDSILVRSNLFFHCDVTYITWQDPISRYRRGRCHLGGPSRWKRTAAIEQTSTAVNRKLGYIHALLSCFFAETNTFATSSAGIVVKGTPSCNKQWIEFAMTVSGLVSVALFLLAATGEWSFSSWRSRRTARKSTKIHPVIYILSKWQHKYMLFNTVR